MALSSITVFLYPSFRPDIERLKCHQHCHFLTDWTLREKTKQKHKHNKNINNNNNNNNNNSNNNNIPNRIIIVSCVQIMPVVDYIAVFYHFTI